MALGEHECDTSLADEAMPAFYAALGEFTSDYVPLEWALTQTNLGNALAQFGRRTNDTTQLEQAAMAYRNAPGGCTRDRSPLDWANIQKQ
ncbi:MAG: hypothetical protein ACRBM6_25345 [Geminicoccales bacterium]